MADTNMTTPVLSVCATVSSKVKDLVIKNGQLLFIQDIGRIALDFNNKRVFYNQITELSTEQERLSLLAPTTGYYFVIEKAVLWYYSGEWTKITTEPDDIVFVGTEMPELGVAKTLYVNSTEGNENISIWDENSGYKIVADKTQDCTDEDILNLFG